MALDEALMRRAARTGEVVLRVYSWHRPTLSLGRNQRARGVYDESSAQAMGIDIVRRLTGGRAVLHHREATYSVTAPFLPEDSLTSTYAAINRLLLSGLRSLGVDAELATPRSRMPPPASAPCFELPAAGEIMLRGRKLVGSAQVREQSALLQHGSILIHDDQPLVSQIARVPVGEAAPAATLAGALARDVLVSDIAEALFGALRVETGIAPSRLEPDAALCADVERLRTTYTDDAWTWRR